MSGARTATARSRAGQTKRRWRVLHGDCLELLARLPARSVDAVVCDPPYGINFQGKRWDGRAIRDTTATTTSRRRLSMNEAFQEWTRCWAEECLRVLKPGGHLLAFGSPRTFHRLACGLEDAGLQSRDTLVWLYGTGLPKSRRLPGGRATQLKPAWEPILLTRTPPDGTIENNLALYDTGALNVDTCRTNQNHPANVILGHSDRCTEDACADNCAVATVDHAADTVRALSGPRPQISRLFYCPKANRTERDAGCEHLPAGELNLFPQAQGQKPRTAHNPHPTVKPVTLMRWLVRLACPPGGLVLDPFCGSGSTGIAAVAEHRRFLGIERETSYVQIARARITHAAKTTGPRHPERRTPLASKRRTRR